MSACGSVIKVFYTENCGNIGTGYGIERVSPEEGTKEELVSSRRNILGVGFVRMFAALDAKSRELKTTKNLKIRNFMIKTLCITASGS